MIDFFTSYDNTLRLQGVLLCGLMILLGWALSKLPQQSLPANVRKVAKKLDNCEVANLGTTMLAQYDWCLHSAQQIYSTSIRQLEQARKNGSIDDDELKCMYKFMGGVLPRQQGGNNG